MFYIIFSMIFQREFTKFLRHYIYIYIHDEHNNLLINYMMLIQKHQIAYY